MRKVTVLLHTEGIDLDSDQLAMLYGELGETKAEAAIARALEDIANKLSEIERAYYTTDRATLAKTARGLIGVVDQAGLSHLGQVALDVHNLAARSDEPALAAALARLVRLGDRALQAIWEVQDLTNPI